MPKKNRGTQAAKRTKVSGRPRKLEVPKRIWYKPLTWRNRPPVPAYKPLPKARKLFTAALRQLWSQKKLFGGIVIIYGALNLLLVHGFGGNGDVTNIKALLDSLVHGFGGRLTSAAATFLTLLASSGGTQSEVSSVYQTLLLLVFSLAFIWALRQTLAKHKVRVRDSFYQGLYPLAVFFLVFLLLCVQLLPLVLGSSLYGTVVSNGIVVYWWEKAIFIAVFALAALWSLRMVTASIFALYIATLPDMTPLAAYRSARQLVYGRRLLIWRKIIFLPVVLVLLAALVEVPLIFLFTPAAVWMFFVLGIVALPVVHGYLYNLYREML